MGVTSPGGVSAVTDVPSENSSRTSLTCRPRPARGMPTFTLDNSVGAGNVALIHSPRGSPSWPTCHQVAGSPSKAFAGRNSGESVSGDPYADAVIATSPGYSDTVCVSGRSPNTSYPVPRPRRVWSAGRVYECDAVGVLNDHTTRLFESVITIDGSDRSRIAFRSEAVRLPEYTTGGPSLSRPALAASATPNPSPDRITGSGLSTRTMRDGWATDRI